MRTFTSAAELQAAEGQELGTSDWLTITQEAVNQFADATGDHQWIHVDPEKAAKALRPDHRPRLHDAVAGAGPDAPDLLRRGHQAGDQLRPEQGSLPSPVPVGSKVRATATLQKVEDLGNGALQLTVATTFEVEGSDKPACVAESILRYMF